MVAKIFRCIIWFINIHLNDRQKNFPKIRNIFHKNVLSVVSRFFKNGPTGCIRENKKANLCFILNVFTFLTIMKFIFYRYCNEITMKPYRSLTCIELLHKDFLVFISFLVSNKARTVCWINTISVVMFKSSIINHCL